MAEGDIHISIQAQWKEVVSRVDIRPLLREVMTDTAMRHEFPRLTIPPCTAIVRYNSPEAVLMRRGGGEVYGLSPLAGLLRPFLLYQRLRAISERFASLYGCPDAPESVWSKATVDHKSEEMP